MRYQKLRVCLLLAAMLTLTGCIRDLAPSNAATVPSTVQTAPTALPTQAPTEPLPDRVSGEAVKDYLLPLENFSWERKYAPEYVMLHFTSAVTLSKDDPYNMAAVRSIFADYGVSIHYIIDRDGTVYCYVPENLVAWHAGAGVWKNDPKYTNRLNDYAIGIEILAIGSQSDMAVFLTEDEYNALDPDLIGYTDAQYAALKALVADICQRNGIPMDRRHIIGHQEYASQKTDPGELFDWSRLDLEPAAGTSE